MAGPAQTEVRLRGVALSDGCAVARVCLFNERRHSNLPLYRVPANGANAEKARLSGAVGIAAGQIDTLRERVGREIGRAEAEIFVAQRMILEDPLIQSSIAGIIDARGVNAETAVTEAFDEYEQRLQRIDNAYIRERASDIGEIKRRVLDALANMRPSLQCSDEHCQKGRNRIIVAEELTPSLTVDLDTRHTLGFVTERGGRESHAAILARALGIPAVSGLPGLRDRVSCGMPILVSGTTGDVVLWPAEETVRDMRAAAADADPGNLSLDPVPGLRVLANISSAADAEDAVRMRAEGIGLYRTEMEWIAAGSALDEETLLANYRSVVNRMDGKPVLFRALDVGTDKPLSFLGDLREENPALGWRGARLLLGSPDLLRPQARALARLSREAAVSVMYPMVIDVAQFTALRALFGKLSADIACGDLRHGVMFEVPSACLQAEAIFREAEFGSVGTNDLVQYLFAVDRNNARVADDFRPDHPVFWELIARVVAAARAAGRPLSVCGEMAGDPRFVRRFLEAGIDALSVSSRRIAVVRGAARTARASGVRVGRDDGRQSKEG